MSDQNCVINMRVSVAEKKRLAAAAKGMGLSLSAFLRMAAIEEARLVLRPATAGASAPALGE